jgi:hypothetical protein
VLLPVEAAAQLQGPLELPAGGGQVPLVLAD